MNTQATHNGTQKRGTQSAFAHCSGGNWYLSSDAKGDFQTLEQYKQHCKTVYGSLHGIKFAVLGVEYDGFDSIGTALVPRRCKRAETLADSSQPAESNVSTEHLAAAARAIGDAMCAQLPDGEVTVEPANDGKSVLIVKIMAGVEQRGDGTRAMLAATKVADAFNVRLTLSPDGSYYEDQTAAEARLRGFYARFGFGGSQRGLMSRESPPLVPVFHELNGESLRVMHQFEVEVLAIDSDDGPENSMGAVRVTGEHDIAAVNKAHDLLWDRRIGIACHPQYKVAQVATLDLAAIDTEMLKEELRRRGLIVAVWGAEDMTGLLEGDERTQPLSDGQFATLQDRLVETCAESLQDVVSERGNTHIGDVWAARKTSLLQEVTQPVSLEPAPAA